MLFDRKTETGNKMVTTKILHAFIFFTIGLLLAACTSKAEKINAYCNSSSGMDNNIVENTAILAGEWGNGLTNMRYQPMNKSGLSPDEVSRLKLKWAFKMPESEAPRSQPAVTKDTVYLGSEKGDLFALDKTSGCIKWQQKIEGEVRTSLVLTDIEKKGRFLFFGDNDANVYALDARSGELVWQKKLDKHDAALITAAPAYHNGRLYVSVSSLEVIKALNPAYPCCTFRGSVVALDASSGDLIWKSYTVDEAEKKHRNKIGIQQWGPSGAPIWNTPSIDVKRNRLYVGTGENYNSPATEMSDAVIAMDLDNGEILWHQQLTAGDAWNMSCTVPFKISCPEGYGLDLDIGAAIMHLTDFQGKDLLIAGQKSAIVFALDPDNEGAVIWKKKLGRGGALGGVHWGMAADEKNIYVPINDLDLDMMIFNAKNPEGEKQPGLNAIDISSGELKWHYSQKTKCDNPDKCGTGMSSPPTVIPGVVFATNLDGEIKAFSSETGEILWSYDTTQEVDTVSGELGFGGAIDVAGPVIAAEQVFIQSGYKVGTGGNGNVLLSFSVDGK